MPCTPPFHPSPGHKSKVAHDCLSTCMYYAVWAGRVRGVYTNLWIARSMTDGYTDALAKGFKKWAEVETWWTALCQTHHQGHCPPFEGVNFPLDPSPITHPSSAACTIRVANRTASSSSADRTASSSSAATNVPTAPIAAPVDDGIRVRPLPAGSPFGAASFMGSPTPKKEEPTTPSLHLSLTPTGHAPSPAPLPPRAPSPEDPPLPALDPPSVAATPAHPRARNNEAPRPSVLVTPSDRGAQAGPVALAPAAAAAPEPTPQMFGIRGVSVFYPTHAAALTAARLLNIREPRIMVSSNAAKLTAWMTLKLFVGEDDA
ncbi:hypothetical protein B0H14DRAFT_3459925 [Mycena olivaceomarginata]|nr:hypothetical protein B0H14DRAFT_3459925 [Mycena olivaceomarginata]